MFRLDAEHLSRQEVKGRKPLAQAVCILFYQIGQARVAAVGTAVDLVSLRRGIGAVMSSLCFLFLSPPPQDRSLQNLTGSLSSGSQSGPKFQSKHPSQILPGFPSTVFHGQELEV